MSKEIDDIDDDDFMLLEQRNRHKELLGVFNKLLSVISKQKDSSIEISQIVNTNNKATDEFLNKLKSISFPTPEINFTSPEVRVETNQTDVVNSINNATKMINDKQDKIIGLLNKLIEVRTADVELIPKRTYGGLIEKVTAHIVVNKPKYQA